MTGKARYLMNLYKENKIDKNNLENAVAKGWITEEEKNEILEEV